MYSVRILVTGRIHCVINSVCNVVYYDLRIDVTTHMTFSRKCISYVYAYYRIIITMHICITMTM